MLKEINVDDNQEWDEVVKSFHNYDVFYLNSYAKAFQKQGEGRPILIYIESNGIRAMNVIMERDIAENRVLSSLIPQNTYFDISSPYGYGGLWSDSEINHDLWNLYSNYCREKGYISEFVRFELFGNYKNIFDGIVETRTHNVIRSLEISLEDMWMDFEHKVRKNIKRANNNGLEIRIDPGECLNDFLRIYYNTMERTQANEQFYFNKDFFKTINAMSDHVAYFYVLYENKIISTELVIYGLQYCYSFLGGTDREFFQLRPNDFLKFEIIKWAKNKGLSNFILGGGYGKDDGIFQYKKSLAPNGIVNFYIGKKIYNQKLYDMLVHLKNANRNDKEINTAFFPLYRA